MAKTFIKILDSNLNEITTVFDPMPLSAGELFTYSKELSEFGQCRFRVSSFDPMFTTFGDILKPHVNHIRLVRGDVTIWSGAIIENSKRTSNFVEVIAAEYEWYLDRIMVNRSSTDPATGKANGIYRIFNSGTMGSAVTSIMNETITTYRGTTGVHPLSNMTLGTINTPNYPPNTTNANNPPQGLSGAYTFGNGTAAPMLTFDFHSIMYILKTFGHISYADFGIDENLVFNFKSFFGKDNHYDVNFTYGKHGNVVDYNIPRLGQQMANDLIGIAVDNSGTVLHAEQTDQASITTNGIIQAVSPYADIKDQATLNARVQAELPLISNPSDSPINMVLDEKAYPLGLFDIGDIVTVNVNDGSLAYSAIKRVVGISVSVHNTGRELTTVQMNTPLPWEYGSV